MNGGATVASPAEVLNALLWLYRRLPRAYGRPPHIEQPIKALAKRAGIDVDAFLAERGSVLDTAAWSTDLQKRLIDLCKDQDDEIRNVMAEAACALLAVQPPVAQAAAPTDSRECRHCGWECRPNYAPTKTWYPLGEPDANSTTAKSAAVAAAGVPGGAMAEAWEDALSHAAFYVTDHCVDGEFHAEAIMTMKRPAEMRALRDLVLEEAAQIFDAPVRAELLNSDVAAIIRERKNTPASLTADVTSTGATAAGSEPNYGERYLWLEARFIGYDYFWGGHPLAENDVDRGKCVIVIEVGRNFRGGSDLGAAIDDAIANKANGGTE